MTSRVLVALRVAAPPERVFAAFTDEVDQWWQPHPLFEFTESRAGRVTFESGPGGRFTETYDDGQVFEIGRIRAWEPPHRLVFSWRQANFPEGRETEVHVHFHPTGDETRVTVEHFGWDAIPQSHAARHGFPLLPFQQRNAEWWRAQLDRLDRHTADDGHRTTT